MEQKNGGVKDVALPPMALPELAVAPPAAKPDEKEKAKAPMPPVPTGDARVELTLPPASAVKTDAAKEKIAAPAVPEIPKPEMVKKDALKPVEEKKNEEKKPKDTAQKAAPVTAPATGELPPLPGLVAKPDSAAAPALPSLSQVTGDKPATNTSDAQSPLSFLNRSEEVKAKPLPLPPLGAPDQTAKMADAKMADTKAEKPAETKAASLPDSKTAAAPAAKGSQALSIPFNSTETAVPLSVQGQLADVAKKLVQDKQAHARVVAYAAGTAEQASTARRVSLSRALAVRAFLIDQGVENLRIDVQLGNSTDSGGAPDRADIFITPGTPAAGAKTGG